VPSANLYTERGELWKSYRSQSYPVESGYDAQGRLAKLKTWQNFAEDSGVTTNTWKYDGYRSAESWRLTPDTKPPLLF
jgi:hypothetical protein